jgi:hypothetical protein
VAKDAPPRGQVGLLHRSLLLRRKKDGSLHLMEGSGFPEEVLFTSPRIMEWIAAGAAGLEGDLLHLDFSGATATYEIVDRGDPARDEPKTRIKGKEYGTFPGNSPDAWLGRLVRGPKPRKGK